MFGCFICVGKSKRDEKSFLRYKVNSFKVEMSLVTDGGVHGLIAFPQNVIYSCSEKETQLSVNLQVNHFSLAFGIAACSHPNKQRGDIVGLLMALMCSRCLMIVRNGLLKKQQRDFSPKLLHCLSLHICE